MPRAELIVSAYPFPPFLGADPIKLFTSAIVRKAPRSLGAHVKSLNYLDAIVAKQQAGELGVHDAVMLDSLGAVAECTGANLFIVVGDTLVTPTTRAALPGITRRTVLEIAAEQGIEAVERDIWPMELHGADGAFVCGSGAGIVPIGSFDGRPVTQPEHPLIERIQEAYRERTRSTNYRTELYVGTANRSTLSRHETSCYGTDAASRSSLRRPLRPRASTSRERSRSATT